jgi:hypothetical protein
MKRQMDKHVTVLGALYIAFGALNILVAIIVWTVVVGGGLISGDEQAIAITTGIGSAIVFILVLLAAPGIIGGVGLLKWRPWARILVLILGCLHLFHIPFGTALGIYTIWVLVQDETVKLFASGPPSASHN